MILYGGVGPDWVTRIASGLFATVMLGAIFMVHWSNGWNYMTGYGEGTNNMGGMEFQVMTFAVSLFLLTRGNAINE